MLLFSFSKNSVDIEILCFKDILLKLLFQLNLLKFKANCRLYTHFMWCDGETQFHFNFVDRSFFVFCGSNHLRFEKTTTSAENCFLHTSLAADLPLNSNRNVRGIFR